MLNAAPAVALAMNSRRDLMPEVYRSRATVQASGMAFEVNGELISNAEIRAEMAALRLERERSGEEVSLEDRLALRRRAVETLIESRILLQEARRLELTPPESEIERVAALLAPRGDGVSGCRAGADTDVLRREAERRLMIGALLDHWSSKVPLPSASAVNKYYRENREEFALPEMVRVAHIVKNFDGEDHAGQRERVAQMRERIVGGEDFARVAAVESDCPENGGELGWVAKGTMVEEFDDVVFAAAPGELTEVFETRFGAHIALVHEKRAAGTASLDEAAESIREGLHTAKMDDELGRRSRALLARASIREVA
jgi:parvulin-like peptidyl-prolyl isomerase